ncbi:hypothetical protein G9X53_16025 [Cronobacter dublinensis]|nr:hypothetical protein [Cronobacter dublinensis]
MAISALAAEPCLLEKHYSLTLSGTLFSNETVMQEHIETGILLIDAVNFLMGNYG